LGLGATLAWGEALLGADAGGVIGRCAAVVFLVMTFLDATTFFVGAVFLVIGCVVTVFFTTAFFAVGFLAAAFFVIVFLDTDFFSSAIVTLSSL